MYRFCIYCPVQMGRMGTVNLGGHSFALRAWLFVQSHPDDMNIYQENEKNHEILLFTMANFVLSCAIHVSIIILYFVFFFGFIVVEFHLDISSKSVLVSSTSALHLFRLFFLFYLYSVFVQMFAFIFDSIPQMTLFQCFIFHVSVRILNSMSRRFI